MSKQQYFIIDKRSFVGNDVLFWGPDHSGYMTDVDKAGKYDKEEAEIIDAGRSTDVAIPVEEVLSVCKRVVDHQHLNIDYFRSGFSVFTKNQSENYYEKKLDLMQRKINKIENLFQRMDNWEEDYCASDLTVREAAKEEFLKIISEKEIR